MPAFIVATVRIGDPETFARYAQAIAGLSETFGGRTVMKGVAGEILEGDHAPGERVVVSEFPSADDARAYIASDQYRSASQIRKGAAEVVMRLVVA